MNILRFAWAVLTVCLLSTSPANAVQISLSSENVQQYFHILEIYVLPFLVVSTIVLLCGYIASKIYNRRLNKSAEDLDAEQRLPANRDEGTAAFLRELKSTPPIKDPVPETEPRLRLRRRQPKKEAPAVEPAPRIATEDRPDFSDGGDRTGDADREPLLLRVPASVPTDSDDRPDHGAANEPRLRPLATERSFDAPDALPDTLEDPAPTRDPAPPRDETRAGLEVDTAADADLSVPVEPGDAPYLETPFDLKAGDDTAPPTLPAPVQNPEPMQLGESARISDGDPVETEPDRLSADAPIDLKLSRADDDIVAQEPEQSDESEHTLSSDRWDEDETPSSSALERTAWWADSSASSDRIEPSVGVVQPLKPMAEKAPSRETRNAEKAAGEIVRSLDRITSGLQQNMTVLADHIRHRRGMMLEDVQSLRISGFSAGIDIADRLRVLDQQAVTDVHASYAAVESLNRIVDRLEEMATDDALDEGWNDLIRTRLSETIYVVGQGKKTLSPYLPAESSGGGGNEPDDTADGTERSPHSGGVPFGNRQG